LEQLVQGRNSEAYCAEWADHLSYGTIRGKPLLRPSGPSLEETKIADEITALKDRIAEKEQSRVIEFSKGNGGTPDGAGKRFVQH